MIYSEWMSYIKDDVKLRDVVMPSAHNAGSFKMKPIACCQDGDLSQQFEYGVRHFCVRIDTDKNGQIVFCHGMLKGQPFEPEMMKLRKVMDENPSEFIILDIREYQPQKFGPLELKFHADPKKVDDILERSIEPSKYAFTDFENISDVTMGDMRKSGKRFIMINYCEEYKYSVNCPHILPWEKKRHGKRAYEFVTEATDFFDTCDTSGFYWFQTQQTPNFGTDIGIVFPRKLDKALRWHFKALINNIASNPKYLAKANIISGDFMTEDHFKVREILNLNLKKNNIIEYLRDEYKSRLKACT